MRKKYSIATAALAVGAIIAFGASGAAYAASAGISPNTQNTTGEGLAHWTESWSGGTGRFYPNAASSSYVAAASSYSYGFDSCSSATIGQELDVYSGTTIVAAATSTTHVIKSNPCAG